MMNGPDNKFEFLGFGLLNAIYDSVHRRIIIASDNRKIEAAQVDIPKAIQSSDLVTYSKMLLDRVYYFI